MKVMLFTKVILLPGKQNILSRNSVGNKQVNPAVSLIDTDLSLSLLCSQDTHRLAILCNILLTF